MIITTHLNIKMGGKNIKHYKELGYNVKLYETICVPLERISVGSHYPVDVQCDYCKNVVSKAYKSILNERKKSHTKKDCCSNCIHLKNKDTNLNLYGVENTFQRKETKDKIRKTNLLIYGVEYITQNKEIAKRASEAQKSMSDEKKLKRKEKTRKTVFERYGVDFVLQLEKTRIELFKTRTSESSQQKTVFNMLLDKYGKENVFSNFHESKLSLDILVLLNDVKIDVEYDSWYWHNKDRDRKRDELLKSRGYKVLRIKSGRKIPTQEVLFKKIESLAFGKSVYSRIILDDWNEEEYSKKEDK